MHEYMSSGAERGSANIKALRRLTKCITEATSAAAVDQYEEMTHVGKVQKQQKPARIHSELRM